jgi:hypothetical protein
MHIDDLVIAIKLHPFTHPLEYLFYLFILQLVHHYVILGKTLESYLLSEPHKSAQTLILLRSTKIFVQ